VAERIQGFLLRPSKTFDARKEDSFTDVFRYYISLLIKYAILASLTGFLTLIELMPEPSIRVAGLYDAAILVSSGCGKMGLFLFPVVLFLTSVVILMAAAIAAGLWTHLWVHLAEGRNGITQTMNAVMHGATPFFVLGWIPHAALIGIVWSAVVQVIGLTQTQGIPAKRAVAAYAVSLLPLVIILIASL
jgi:hypothetical protein